MLLPPPLPGSPATADDLLDALDFVRRRFEQWHKEGRVKDGQWQALTEHYAKRRELIDQARQAGQTEFTSYLRRPSAAGRVTRRSPRPSRCATAAGRRWPRRR